MKLLDKGTYGNSAACEILVDIMNKNNIQPHRIGKILTNFNQTIYELEKIDRKIGLGLAHMSYKHYRNVCDSLPTEVRTYVKNVLNMNYKKWLEKVKAQKPTKFMKTFNT